MSGLDSIAGEVGRQVFEEGKATAPVSATWKNGVLAIYVVVVARMSMAATC